MLREAKAQSVEFLTKVCEDYSAIFVTHYHGMTVPEVFELKRTLKQAGANFKVVKNSLFKIAADKSGKGVVRPMASGPVSLVYSSDVAGAAKIIDKFAAKNSNLKIIGALLDYDVLGPAEVVELAKLPSFDEIRARLLSVISAPATRLASILNSPARSVLGVMQAHINN